MQGRILLIGELITNSGAGLQGDIITVTALGGIPLTATTQISAGTTPLKQTFHTVDPNFISQQISASLESPGVDSIKIGVLPSLPIVEEVIKCLESIPKDTTVTMCPITISDLGTAFISPECNLMNQRDILQWVNVLVLSIQEAELLSGEEILDLNSMCEVGHSLLKYGPKAVLITGGVLAGENHYDVLVTSAAKEQVLSHRKSQNQIEEKYNFCGAWVLATAIATRLGQGYSLTQALNHARQYVNNAILRSEKNETQYQNLNLIHTIAPFAANEISSAYSIISDKNP